MNQSNQPLVSVVIPCYNHERFVQDSIQSVIDQTYQHIELIIIDDGSQDGSVEKIQEMIPTCKERFFRFEFRYRPNKGLSATLNEALVWCQGEYYSPIASDDIILDYKIEKQVRFLESNLDCIAVFGGITMIDENCKEISTRVLKSKSYSFQEILMLEHELPAPTQMIRLSAVKKVGCYNVNVKLEDWYMWLLLAQEGKLCYQQELYSKYRSHENNTFKQHDIMHQGRLYILAFYKNNVLYNKAKMRIMWIHCFELCMSSKKKALSTMLDLVKNNNTELFSYNFLRFMYHLLLKPRKAT